MWEIWWNYHVSDICSKVLQSSNQGRRQGRARVEAEWVRKEGDGIWRATSTSEEREEWGRRRKEEREGTMESHRIRPDSSSLSADAATVGRGDHSLPYPTECCEECETSLPFLWSSLYKSQQHPRNKNVLPPSDVTNIVNAETYWTMWLKWESFLTWQELPCWLHF